MYWRKAVLERSITINSFSWFTAKMFDCLVCMSDIDSSLSVSSLCLGSNTWDLCLSSKFSWMIIFLILFVKSSFAFLLQASLISENQILCFLYILVMWSWACYNMACQMSFSCYIGCHLGFGLDSILCSKYCWVFVFLQCEM